MDNGDPIKSISIKKNIMFLSMIRILTYFIPLITAPYLSRVFGPDGIGEYTYVFSIVSYFSLAVNFGFTGYGVREIGSFRNDRQRFSNSFWSIIAARGVLFALAFTSYITLFFCLKSNSDVSIEIYLALSLTIFSNLFDITFLFQGLENLRVVSIVNFLIRIVGLVFLFLLVKSKEDLLLYTIIQALQLLFIAIIPWYFVKKTILKPDIKQIKLKSVFIQALYYFLPTLAVTLCSLVDKTMLGSMSTKSEVGYYEQADKLIVVVIGVLHSFAEAFTSRISFLIHEKKEDDANEKISKMFQLYALVGIPAVVGLFVVGSDFVILFYGDSFAPSVSVFYFLVPLIVFKSLSNALGNVYYSPRGLMWMTSIYYTVGSAINILINAFLIPQIGAKGAAIASLISEFLIAVMFSVFARSKLQYNLILRRGAKPFAAAMIMCIVLLLLNCTLLSYVSVSFKLFSDIIIGAAVYCFVLVALKERTVIDELTKRLHRSKQ